jgi:adenosylmethionine-8-amino-7-oxononanoate aminotransferase
VARRIWQRAFELGLVIYYSTGCADGTNGDIVMLGPPLIINEAQIDELVAVLSRAMASELR